jgi:hypothetical protein
MQIRYEESVPPRLPTQQSFFPSSNIQVHKDLNRSTEANQTKKQAGTKGHNKESSWKPEIPRSFIEIDSDDPLNLLQL